MQEAQADAAAHQTQDREAQAELTRERQERAQQMEQVSAQLRDSVLRADQAQERLQQLQAASAAGPTQRSPASQDGSMQHLLGRLPTISKTLSSQYSSIIWGDDFLASASKLA